MLQRSMAKSLILFNSDLRYRVLRAVSRRGATTATPGARTSGPEGARCFALLRCAGRPENNLRAAVLGVAFSRERLSYR